jgi:LytS/YehU family sensor histidine kinase
VNAIKGQMNPHFISNSMAAIQNLIYNKEYVKASQYLAKSTFLMRQVLDLYDKTYVSLEEEIQFMKLNIELEQLRFNANFSFRLEIEENIDLKQVLIPTLITQPLIENAIWHGLLPLTERDPQLTVSVYTENAITCISIEDNGVGRKKDNTGAERESRGLKLVMDKIDLINQLRGSRDFSLTIQDLVDKNQEPSGTRIVIQLFNYNQEI